MILLGDAAAVLKDFEDDSIDLTVTSPPYDSIRIYGGYEFDFETIAANLYDITKEGGVVVWIVGDQTANYTESGSSFRQALHFKEIGFNLHDTMILKSNGFTNPSTTLKRYHQSFEYMFILSKGQPKTFNPINDRKNISAGTKYQSRHKRYKNNKLKYWPKEWQISDYGMRLNVWDKPRVENTEHPAPFSESLAEDHIKSWSNEGDTVLDPFAGSGTTLKAAHQLNRKWIGIEINPEYVELAKKRLMPYIQQQRLEQFLNSSPNVTHFGLQCDSTNKS